MGRHKPGTVGFHYVLRAARQVGGPWTRLSVVLMEVTFVTFMALWFLLFYLHLNQGWPLEVALAFALSGLSYAAYNDAISTPLLSAPVLREAIRQGWTKPDDEYYEELARIREVRGDGERFTEAMAWALAFWVMFYGTLLGAIPFVLATHSTFGYWSTYLYLAIVLPVAIASSLGYSRRNWRQFKEAEAAGSRVMELYYKRSDIATLRRLWRRE
jgi:hypothetical protein